MSSARVLRPTRGPDDDDPEQGARVRESSPDPQSASADAAKAARPPAAEAAPSAPRRRRWLPFSLLFLAFAGLLYIGGDWVRTRLLYVHEVDARVVTDMVSVAARVEGWLTALDVGEGDQVKVGQRLAQVDPRAAALRLEERDAELAALQAEREQLAARKVMLEAQTASRVRSARSRMNASAALAESLGHELSLVRTEFQRAEKLSRNGVISGTEFDRSRTAYQRAEQAVLRARAQVAEEQAALTEAEADRQELGVLDAEARVVERRVEQYQARVARERLMVADHAILSPSAGVITRTFVESGEYVREGQRIALLHDPDNVWVEANIRETEIRSLAVGQTVRVVVDAFPDEPLEGVVARLGYATTGEFALLPAPNPSGNFTKVTQRIPVKIAVANPRGRLRPGMLVEIDINIAEGDAASTDAPRSTPGGG